MIFVALYFIKVRGNVVYEKGARVYGLKLLVWTRLPRVDGTRVPCAGARATPLPRPACDWQKTIEEDELRLDCSMPQRGEMATARCTNTWEAALI